MKDDKGMFRCEALAPQETTVAVGVTGTADAQNVPCRLKDGECKVNGKSGKCRMPMLQLNEVDNNNNNNGQSHRKRDPIPLECVIDDENSSASARARIHIHASLIQIVLVAIASIHSFQ